MSGKEAGPDRHQPAVYRECWRICPGWAEIDVTARWRCKMTLPAVFRRLTPEARDS